MLRTRLSKSLILVIILTLALYPLSSACSNSNPGEKEAGKTYSKGEKKGWWWYEKEKVKPEEKKVTEKEVPKHRIPNMDDYTLKKLWNMHPDDFQDLLMDFQKEAVRQPTEKNVLNYYVMQDIARRKSLAFAHVASFVVQKHPRLNVRAESPLNTPGSRAMVKARYNDTNRVLKDNRDDFALLYFTAPGCKYCDAQDGILVYFKRMTDWTIKPINVREQPALAARFGIERTPSIILIYKKSRDFFPVSAGITDVPTLKTNLARGIQYLKGEITPEQYGIYEHQRGGVFDPRSLLKQEN